jgi:hypothetical protein
MSIARLVVVAALLALAGCSSPTDPGGDLATGNGSPSGGPGHKVPITGPCEPTQCRIRLELDSRALGAAVALRPDSPSR